MICLFATPFSKAFAPIDRAPRFASQGTHLSSGLAQTAPAEEFLKLCDPLAIAATTPMPPSSAALVTPHPRAMPSASCRCAPNTMKRLTRFPRRITGYVGFAFRTARLGSLASGVNAVQPFGSMSCQKASLSGRIIQVLFSLLGMLSPHGWAAQKRPKMAA
jgi:hypothetical protein